MINKNYCMSSYLTFRFIGDENINFFENMTHKVYKPKDRKYGCSNYLDIDKAIREILEKEFIPNKTALLLSGGMDSAILASYLPKGTKVYTFQCISKNPINETARAKRYAEKYDLDHEIIEITWNDYLELTPKVMKNNNVPVHSIEPQLLKAAAISKRAGIEKIITGASSDFVFGGYDKLLSKDWTYADFIKRYTFVDPYLVLKEPVSMENIFHPYKNGNNINFLEFMQNVSLDELNTSYENAFDCGNIKYVDPYLSMFMKEPLDLVRIRNGESKYLIRELFRNRYTDIKVPEKIPMPRSVNDWMENWEGPKRHEFREDININNFTGDQKWLIFCLEWFLNLHNEGKL